MIPASPPRVPSDPLPSEGQRSPVPAILCISCGYELPPGDDVVCPECGTLQGEARRLAEMMRGQAVSLVHVLGAAVLAPTLVFLLVLVVVYGGAE